MIPRVVVCRLWMIPRLLYIVTSVDDPTCGCDSTVDDPTSVVCCQFSDSPTHQGYRMIDENAGYFVALQTRRLDVLGVGYAPDGYSCLRVFTGGFLRRFCRFL